MSSLNSFNNRFNYTKIANNDNLSFAGKIEKLILGNFKIDKTLNIFVLSLTNYKQILNQNISLSLTCKRNIDKIFINNKDKLRGDYEYSTN